MDDSVLAELVDEDGPEEIADAVGIIRDSLYSKAARGVEARLRWAEVFDEEEMPDWWLAEYPNEKEARRAFVIAKAAAKNKREAPVALELDQKLMEAIERARAAEKGGSRQLTVNVVNMPQAEELPSKTIKKLE